MSVGMLVPTSQRLVCTDLVILCVLAVTLPSAPLLLAKPEAPLSVIRVYTAPNGSIHIIYSDRKDIKPHKEKGQVACSSPHVAEDQRTAGWLVEYSNCCTSYPIPLTLVIYKSGRVIQRFGNGMLIANWHFLKGGEKVAFYTNTVHGDLAPHYELRNVQTGALLDKWDGILSGNSPEWATELSQ